MDDIISILNNTKIECLPNYIMNDLEYICECYMQGITDVDFSQVSNNMCCQQQDIKIDDNVYNLMFNILRNKLLLKHIYIIDEVLIYTYLDYYIASIKSDFI